MRRWRTVLGLAAALLIGLAGGANAADCSRSAIDAAAARVEAARAAMAAVAVDELDTDTPKAEQAAIAETKARLGELLDAFEACAPADQDIAATNAALARWAKRSKDDAPQGYGQDLAFEAKAWNRDLVGIVATLGIECGDDASLFVFQRGPRGWREVLRYQAAAYDTVAGSFWSFDYAVSPPDAQGRWFVAAKTLAPWCSSTWTSIRYAVLRPGVDPAKPSGLLAKSESLWWGGEDFGGLKVGLSSVEFRFSGESARDDTNSSPQVRRFKVQGDRVIRQPARLKRSRTAP
jgi:hypothetical protein